MAYHRSFLSNPDQITTPIKSRAPRLTRIPFPQHDQSSIPGSDIHYLPLPLPPTPKLLSRPLSWRWMVTLNHEMAQFKSIRKRVAHLIFRNFSWIDSFLLFFIPFSFSISTRISILRLKYAQYEAQKTRAAFNWISIDEKFAKKLRISPFSPGRVDPVWILPYWA